MRTTCAQSGGGESDSDDDADDYVYPCGCRDICTCGASKVGGAFTSGRPSAAPVVPALPARGSAAADGGGHPPARPPKPGGAATLTKKRGSQELADQLRQMQVKDGLAAANASRFGASDSDSGDEPDCKWIEPPSYCRREASLMQTYYCPASVPLRRRIADRPVVGEAPKRHPGARPCRTRSHPPIYIYIYTCSPGLPGSRREEPGLLRGTGPSLPRARCPRR